MKLLHLKGRDVEEENLNIANYKIELIETNRREGSQGRKLATPGVKLSQLSGNEGKKNQSTSPSVVPSAEFGPLSIPPPRILSIPRLHYRNLKIGSSVRDKFESWSHRLNLITKRTRFIKAFFMNSTLEYVE